MVPKYIRQYVFTTVNCEMVHKDSAGSFLLLCKVKWCPRIAEVLCWLVGTTVVCYFRCFVSALDMPAQFYSTV
jgi:hypothetical protein